MKLRLHYETILRNAAFSKMLTSLAIFLPLFYVGRQGLFCRENNGRSLWFPLANELEFTGGYCKGNWGRQVPVLCNSSYFGGAVVPILLAIVCIFYR